VKEIREERDATTERFSSSHSLDTIACGLLPICGGTYHGLHMFFANLARAQLRIVMSIAVRIFTGR